MVNTGIISILSIIHAMKSGLNVNASEILNFWHYVMKKDNVHDEREMYRLTQKIILIESMLLVSDLQSLISFKQLMMKLL